MEQEKKTKIATETQIKRLFSSIQKELANFVYVSAEDRVFLENCFNNKQFMNFIKVDTQEYENLKKAFSTYRKEMSNETSYNVIKQIHHLWHDYEIFSEIMNTTIQSLENKYENIAKEKIKHLENNVQKSDIMLGKQAGDENAKKYLDYAQVNKDTSQNLFRASIIIMLVVAIGAAFLLWDIENIDTAKLWLRIPLGFLILLPAFFMMREAKKLKDKEFQYTDMAYRIITSAPYIDGLNLPSEEKARLKADLVKDFFGRPIECRDDGGLPPIDNICEVIKTCLDSCRKD